MTRGTVDSRTLNLKRIVTRFATIVSITLLTMVILAGCDLVGKSGPEEAKLEIQGENGQHVRLITSRLFLTDRIQDIRDDGSVIDSLAILLITADTSIVDLPFEETYNIQEDQRFYVRVNRLSPKEDKLTARMWIDNELRFERQPDVNRDSLQFIYNFRGSPGQVNVEL